MLRFVYSSFSDHQIPDRGGGYECSGTTSLRRGTPEDPSRGPDPFEAAEGMGQ